jgi:hypothetical protein
MHKLVRNVGTVLNWMKGTRELIQNDDPRFQAAAMEAFNLKTPQDWASLKSRLLAQIDASMRNAQGHAQHLVETHGTLQAEPFIPADKIAAVFQSAMDEHLNDRLTSTALAEVAGVAPPYGPPEKFDSGDAGWIVVIAARLEQALEGKATFVHHADMTSFRYDMLDPTTVALFSDWATGEPPALAIKTAIEKCSPAYTIHLGDTYYAGFGNEVAHNLLASWPRGVQYNKSFALNGNHEMYCGGKPYFKVLSTLGQSASYFNLGNSHWRLIALDTSYCERGGNTPASSWGELQKYQLEWLDGQIQHAQSLKPPARIILLTHHQMFSAFEGDSLGQYLRSQLKPYLDKQNFFAWFWGHEHRGIVYKANPTYNFKARCIGHGGFPYPPCDDPNPAYEVQFPIQWREERCEPDNAWYGMRGFALLKFKNTALHIDYIDQQGGTAFSEDL